MRHEVKTRMIEIEADVTMVLASVERTHLLMTEKAVGRPGYADIRISLRCLWWYHFEARPKPDGGDTAGVQRLCQSPDTAGDVSICLSSFRGESSGGV